MKILHKLLFGLFALIVVAGIVIATFPARYAYRLVADRLGPVDLSDIEGSIWQGRAAHLIVFGQDLGSLRWHLDTLPLLHAALRARLELHGTAIQASALVERMNSGDIAFSDATFSMPASMVAPALDIPSLVLLGEIRGQVKHARLHEAWVDQAAGSVRWQSAAVTGAAQAQFGDLEATFSSTARGGIRGTAHDLGGPLKLSGTFTVDAGQFDVDAVLAARDGNPQVLEALRYVGQPQADGSSHLLIHGRLFKLF